MNFTDIYEIIFRFILIAVGIYHILKLQFKTSLSIIMIFVLSFLSFFLNKIFLIKIDAFSNLIYLIITFMAMYLGSSLKFYDKFKNWDRYIHALSGIAFVGFGIAIAFSEPDIKKNIALTLGFTFSITIHVLWEVLEYISDCLFHGNAQRWQVNHDSINHVSPKAIQPAGLVDTMNDTICCIIGSGFAIGGWWFLL